MTFYFEHYFGLKLTSVNFTRLPYPKVKSSNHQFSTALLCQTSLTQME